MIGRIAGFAWTVFAYFCVATVLALGLGVGFLGSQGRLTHDTLRSMRVVLTGQELPRPVASTEKRSGPATEQPSWEDREAARAVMLRQLELREQALYSGLEDLRFERNRLVDEKTRFEHVQTAFATELENLSQGTLASGEENVRLLWENLKPKQAKEQILLMLEAQEVEKVVSLLAAMPIAKRAKIAGEFKTPDEAEKLAEILRRIREGMPHSELVGQTQRQLQQLDDVRQQ